jgi:hypothetical protein
MCDSDDEATAMAPRYLAGYAAVEIWHHRRRITRLASSPAVAAPAAQPVVSA